MTPAPSGGRVLFLDDDELMVYLVSRLLEQHGYRVSAFTDPAAAIEAVRAAPGDFGLVVSDLMMRGISGLDVARAVREIRAELPVVIASGYRSGDLACQAAEAGVREVIDKPHVVEDFIEALARWLPAKP